MRVKEKPYGEIFRSARHDERLPLKNDGDWWCHQFGHMTCLYFTDQELFLDDVRTNQNKTKKKKWTHLEKLKTLLQLNQNFFFFKKNKKLSSVHYTTCRVSTMSIKSSFSEWIFDVCRILILSSNNLIIFFSSVCISTFTRNIPISFVLQNKHENNEG